MAGWRRLAVLAVLAQLLLAQAGLTQEAKDGSLKTIFASWQHRQHLLNAARYKIAGTVEWKNMPLPPGKPIRPKEIDVLIDLDKWRLRVQSTEDNIIDYPQGNLRYFSLTTLSTFDGKELRCHGRSDALKQEEYAFDMGISRGDLSQKQLDADLIPLFFAHGIVTTVQHSLAYGDLSTALDQEAFDIAGRQNIRGRNCSVLRTEAVPGNNPIFDELLVDCARENSIVRAVCYAGKEPWYNVDVDWKNNSCGWWPDKWTMSYWLEGHVWKIVHLQINSFEPNPIITDDDFTNPVSPGMRVEVQDFPAKGTGLDPRYPASHGYLISPGGDWEAISAKGFTTADGKLLPPEKNRTWIFLTLSTFLLFLGISYFLLRRLRHS